MTDTVRCLLLLSHRLGADQMRELEDLGGGSVDLRLLPDPLQHSFSQVPPGPSFPPDLLTDLRVWIEENGRFGDLAVIQGDFGLTVFLVDLCRVRGLRALYATTTRDASEEVLPDGSVRLTHRFRHRGFRPYLPAPS